MENFIIIIILLFLALYLVKALKKLLLFTLFIIVTILLYIRFNLPLLPSITLTLIVLKGLKDTLFNIKITTMCILKSKNKYKERLLGKIVNILLELNFTMFILISYLALINYAPYVFEINNKSIVMIFLVIYIVQFIKKSFLSKKYSNMLLT
jgi:hypothetical protein